MNVTDPGRADAPEPSKPSRANVSRSDDPLIVRLLATTTRLDPIRLADLYHRPIEDGRSFEESVVRAGLADEHQIAEAYASHYLLPLFEPPPGTAAPVDPNVSAALPAEFCVKHRVAPLSDAGGTLEMAVFTPDSLVLADQIRTLTGRQMRPMFAPLSVIDELILALYGQTPDGNHDPEIDWLAAEPDTTKTLDLTPRQRDAWIGGLNRFPGMALIAGELGSGKSTFLAAAREDHHRDGRPTAAADEIRGRNAARAAAGAVFRGRGVFATIAARDGLAGLAQLRVFGLDATSIADAVRVVVGLRALPRLCPACKQPARITDAVARRWGCNRDVIAFSAAGCAGCTAGFAGVLRLREVFAVDESLAEQIAGGATMATLRNHLQASGAISLEQARREAALAGEIEFV